MPPWTTRIIGSPMWEKYFFQNFSSTSGGGGGGEEEEEESLYALSFHLIM
jgi:hypothetical protein